MRANAKGPFRARYPSGEEYGGYRAYHPQLRKVVAVGTYDKDEANQIWRSWYSGETIDRTGMNGQLGASVPEIHPPTSLPRTEANGMINFDSPEPQSTKPSDDVLASFLSANKEAVTSTTPPISQPTITRQDTPVIPITRALPGRPPKKGQDPVELAKKAERNLKLAAGLKGMVTQVNVVAAGMAVKLFGRNPAEPDEAEIAMLKEAWEAYIDELFGKVEVQPWVLLLIGNVMIGMSMYANGEPIPKKKPQPQVPGAEVAQ